MTPDQDLSARLAAYREMSAPIKPGMPEHPKYGRAYGSALKVAHRSGHLITLADHEAAVAKAVEAERAIWIEAVTDQSGDMAAVYTKHKAAAIRSRGVKG